MYYDSHKKTGRSPNMKFKFKMSMLLIVVAAFAYSCSKGNSKPTYKYKAPVGDGIAAKAGDIVITEKELLDGLESELYELEKKKFEMKFNRLRSKIIEKLMDKDPKKKGLSNDEYMDKYITKDLKISEKQVDAFVVERKIPKEQVTPQIKERIKQYLLVEEKKVALEKWMGKKAKSVDVFFTKPRRPTFDVVVGNAPFIGGKDAKVEIVEFSDFQCPFCAKASGLVQELKKKYGNKIKVAFKQYPLPFHSQAKMASVAALCANEQNTKHFWKLHDAFFADQSKLSVEDIKKTAKGLGVDSTKFDKCLDDKKFLSQVEADIEQGKKLGVKSTPTFYVNGQLVAGAQPIEVFEEIIEEELSR